MRIRKRVGCVAWQIYDGVCRTIETASTLVHTAAKMYDVIYENGYDDAAEGKNKRLMSERPTETEEQTEETAE